ncbi:UPF0149 family protein [Sulfurirhabdus autotrophica]|uniref:YecA family protein n=1 Tax=Sulfurirhabdus autotrophica TaxID=1706046 RepID=A0A4R3YEN9_9PROT|nr:UPF0149 family protein [Sulfurirhabdus autotrophica]TCV90637.1 uncharacterized protein EDC63_101611 [Sulfurirhabdus autotrophica]
MESKNITEQETDQLEDLLASDIFNNEAMTLDYLQGFLCAVASGPDLIPPSIWIPAALGDSPEYESAAQAETVLDLLMKFYNTIASALQNDEEFDLILYEMDDESEELDYAAWCEAYVYGTQIGEINWIEAAGEFAPDLSEKMEAFFLLSGMLKDDAEKHNEPWLSKKDEEKAIAMAQEDFLSTINDLYRFWQIQRTPQNSITRDAPKVGRNDPCPCGSGKKFKQCCGVEPTLH